ncbi:peptidoglycan recognition protein family protein [Streptomyces rochei]|uniref:peptidoglycan recognition protein family protein n=1 Tax=Streptomyces rochei TaxID=1928 RepID=UPI00403A31A3
MALKLVSRSQWGARAYRTPNGATPYGRARRGVKLHYLGTPYSDRAHDKCDDYVRQIQAQHMDGNGWSDIGYSFVVCTHGYVYEGRGLKRRNSANGNTSLNDQDYAVLLLVGSSGLTKPTDAQLDGARDAIEYCRKSGPAGSWIGGHRDGYATSCPGDAVYAWVKAGAPRPKTAAPSKPATEEDDMPSAKEIAAAVMEYQIDDPRTEGTKYVPVKSVLWWAGADAAQANAKVRDLEAQLAAVHAKLDRLLAANTQG